MRTVINLSRAVVAFAAISLQLYCETSAETRLLSFDAQLAVQGLISDAGNQLDSVSSSKTFAADLTSPATPPHLRFELPWSMSSSAAMSIEGKVYVDYDFAAGSYGIPLNSPSVFLDWFTTTMYAHHEASFPVVNSVAAFDVHLQSKMSVTFELDATLHPFNQISGLSEYRNDFWYYPNQELKVDWTLIKPDGSEQHYTTADPFFPATDLSFEQGTYTLTIETKSRIFGLQDPPWYPTGEGVGQIISAGTYLAVDQVVPEPRSLTSIFVLAVTFAAFGRRRVPTSPSPYAGLRA